MLDLGLNYGYYTAIVVCLLALLTLSLSRQLKGRRAPQV
jgi:hypothetical protein